MLLNQYFSTGGPNISQRYLNLVILFLLKGIVHPKMKSLSSFTRTSVDPKLYGTRSSVEHKIWRMLGTETDLLSTFFKISSFVFHRGKKVVQIWNNTRVTKWWQTFYWTKIENIWSKLTYFWAYFYHNRWTWCSLDLNIVLDKGSLF